MRCAQLKGYSKYWIYEDGSVYSEIKKRVLKISRAADGYYYYTLRSDLGQVTRISRHRVMALCFLGPQPKSKERIVVNHINGVRGDDWLGNLEWCTDRYNLEHAGWLGINPKYVPVQAKNARTGEILTFKSMIAAAIHFKLHKDSLQYRLRRGPHIIHYEGWQYKRLHDKREWPIGKERAVVVRSPFTGEETIMKNLASVCNKFNICPASGTKWVLLEHTPVLPGYFQMRMLDDIKDWSEHLHPELSLANFCNTTPVYVKNQVGKLVKIYYSATECAKELGIRTNTLAERFKTKIKFEHNDLWYSKVCLQSDLQVRDF